MSRRLKAIRQQFTKKLNNSGSAMVIVIIAIAFIGILASVLMYTSMLNYQMKVNNLKAKDNFYSAESVLDEIRMGMQSDVSASIKGAYSSVLENFDTTTADTKKYRMRYYFLSEMQSRYKVGTDTGSYDLCKIYDYVVNTATGTVLETKDSAGNVYTITRNAAGDYVDEMGNVVPAGTAKGVMTLYEDGLSLRDLKVTYTDANDYVSIIETDLRVQLPDMEFAQAVSLPSLTNFSLVAKENIIAVPADISLTSENTIRGSFYGERLIVGSDSDPKNLSNTDACKVTLKLEENPATADSDKRMVVAKDLYIGQGGTLTADKYGELWVDSISMHGGFNGVDSAVNFKGTDVYVAGDLEISGDGNFFEVGEQQADGSFKGQYVGFGKGELPEDGSAIVINGVNTELKLDELAELTLAGNAYIGLSNADSKLTEADGVSNGTVPDVITGQSVAVKSDQIAYLVPAECLGINRTTGESVLTHPTNPMTLENYKAYIQGRGADVAEVSADVACDTLGGKKLSDYGIVTEGAEPMFQRYFKRVNSEITLVYYYVMFDNTDDESLKNANKYFQDYYQVNKATMDAYARLYTDGIQLRDATSGFYTLHLAGNMVNMDASSAELKEATLAHDENNMGYQSELVANQYKFKALSKKMVDVYELLTPAETLDGANAYTNLVRTDAVYGYWTAVDADSTILDKDKAKYFGTTNEKAVVVRGDYTYTGSGEDYFDGLIIATGNVTVNHEFHGTILSGGNITLAQNVKVEPDEEAVLRALTYANTANSLEYHVTDFLLGGDGYLRGSGKTYLDSDINIGELIVYENWEKQ